MQVRLRIPRRKEVARVGLIRSGGEKKREIEVEKPRGEG